MTWAPQDAKELQGIRIALRDIADVMQSKERPDAEKCPACSVGAMHDARQFGTPEHVTETVCGECGCEVTIRRPF